MIRFNSGPLYETVQDGAGGGGGTPGGFDAAAFQAQILEGVNKTLNGFAKTFKADIVKLTTPVTPVVAADPDPAITPDPAASGVKPPADPALAAELRARDRQIKELSAQFAAMKLESDATKASAEKKELDATVRTKLNKYKFADDSAAEDAFEIFGSKVKRNDDGAFVGSDGTPLDQFLEEGIRSKPYLLAPKDVTGGGARNGGSVNHGVQMDMESIKPGMSAAEVAAVSAQILAVMPNRA